MNLNDKIILKEAFDQNELNKIKTTFSELDKLMTLAPKLELLNFAYKKAKQDFRKSMGSMLKGLQGLKVSAKVFVFQASLMNCFKTLPDIVENLTNIEYLSVAPDESIKSLIQLHVNDNKGEDTEKDLGEELRNIIANSIKPPALLGIISQIISFGKSSVPYIEDVNMLAEEFLELSLNDMKKLSQAASGTSVALTQNDAKEMVDDVKEKSEEIKVQQQEEKAKPAEEKQQTQVTQSSEKPPKATDDVKDATKMFQIATDIASQKLNNPSATVNFKKQLKYELEKNGYVVTESAILKEIDHFSGNKEIKDFINECAKELSLSKRETISLIRKTYSHLK